MTQTTNQGETKMKTQNKTPREIEIDYALYLLGKGAAFISGKGEENVYMTDFVFGIEYFTKAFTLRH